MLTVIPGRRAMSAAITSKSATARASQSRLGLRMVPLHPIPPAQQRPGEPARSEPQARAVMPKVERRPSAAAQRARHATQGPLAPPVQQPSKPEILEREHLPVIRIRAGVAVWRGLARMREPPRIAWRNGARTDIIIR